MSNTVILSSFFY